MNSYGAPVADMFALLSIADNPALIVLIAVAVFGLVAAAFAIGGRS